MFMRSFTLIFLCFFSIVTSTGLWSDTTPSKQNVEFHNRVLWSYRGSIITVMDIVKRLEEHAQGIPNYQTIDPNQKLEYYQGNWRAVLQELMDYELIYQDAIDHNMSVTDAEGRDQLVRLYGENYLTRIDGMGLTLKEVLSSVKKDMLIQRMTHFRVQYQARATITPSLVAEAYKELCKQQPETDIWTYQTINFKGETSLCQEIAQNWKKHLLENTSIEECEKLPGNEKVTINTGRLNTQSSLHLSPKYLQILQELQALHWSEPVVFKDDKTQGLVRLFFLKEKTHQRPPSYGEIRRRIEDQLYQDAVAQQNQKYIVKLRRQLELEQGQSLQQVFNPTSPLFFVR